MATRDGHRRALAIRGLLERMHAPAPEERRLRQLDLLEAVRRLYLADRTPVPGWVEDLAREVEAGRL